MKNLKQLSRKGAKKSRKYFKSLNLLRDKRILEKAVILC
jgi:hypothetical protein